MKTHVFLPVPVRIGSMLIESVPMLIHILLMLTDFCTMLINIGKKAINIVPNPIAFRLMLTGFVPMLIDIRQMSIAFRQNKFAIVSRVYLSTKFLLYEKK